MSFGDWLHRQIEKQGISNRELAKRCGLSDVAIGKFISGERVPRMGSLKKLSIGLGKPLDEVKEAAGYSIQAPRVTAEQVAFLEKFDRLPEHFRNAVIKLADENFRPGKGQLEFLGGINCDVSSGEDGSEEEESKN